MGGLCSVCRSGQEEERKHGAWEDFSCDMVENDSYAEGIPTTIHIPVVLKRVDERLTRRRMQLVLSGNTSSSDDEDDDDGDDDEEDCHEHVNDEENDSIANISDSSSSSGDDAGTSCSSDKSILQNASMDLLLSDTDCDEVNSSRDDDNEQSGCSDDDFDDDEDANLLGESLFPTDRDDSNGADDELLLDQSSYTEKPLVMLSNFLRHETEGLLQLFAAEKEPRLVTPSFVEQFNCMGTAVL
ncbi:hypothetical protein MPSEU_001087900 [Mayamaea pseudoterrestris]|nr:hypothetical protein MPSEU_001087900 [Mayamaea pseudoterrestris]